MINYGNSNSYTYGLLVASLFTIIIANLPAYTSSFSINPFIISKQSNGINSSPGEFYEPNDYDLSVQITSYESSSSGRSNAENGSHIQPNQQRGNKLVWVVDDEEAIVDAVGLYLHSSGYQVQTFTNATMPLSLLGAVHKFQDTEQSQLGKSYSDRQIDEDQQQQSLPSLHRLPDAIISDILMPNISGLQFLSVIRSSSTTNKIPFIFLTAKGTTNDRIRGYDSGADGYLMKPFDPDELVAMLDCMVDRREFLDNNSNDNSIGNSQSNNGGVTMEELKKDLKEIKSLLSREENNIALANKQKKGLLKPSPNGSGNDVHMNYIDNSDDEEEFSLTEDEMEVLRLLCDGYMNKEIAEELRYSRRWVEGILTKLFRKTNCSNRTELVKWAVSLGYDDM